MTADDYQICLARCDEMPEIADLLGHDKEAHRIMNALARDTPIRSVGALNVVSDRDLIGVPGIGRGSIRLIRAAIKRCGEPASEQGQRGESAHAGTGRQRPGRAVTRWPACG